MKTTLGLLIAVAIAFYLFTKWKVSAAVSSGNPNYPVPQESPIISSIGPNDGSNSYSGTGHTVYAGPSSDLRRAIEYPILSRGFAYTGPNSPDSGQVVRTYAVY